MKARIVTLPTAMIHRCYERAERRLQACLNSSLSSLLISLLKMDINILISSVFVKNPLWDQSDSQHHNRYVLDKMWDEVADELKSTSKFLLMYLYFLF